jgi:hypothetical protein
MGTSVSPCFEALERERAVSEEAVSNSARNERRANTNNPGASIIGMGGFGGRQQAPASRGIPLSLGAGDPAGGDVEYTAGTSNPNSIDTRFERLNPLLV